MDRSLFGAVGACLALSGTTCAADGHALSPAANVPEAPASASVAATSAEAPTKPGADHTVAARFSAALEAGDATAAATTFADGGVLVRLWGKDAHGSAEIEPVFRQAFGLCKMHVLGLLERATSFVVQTTSTCTHPQFSGEQSHLFVVDVIDDKIARASVLTQAFGKPMTADQGRKELEDPASLNSKRVHDTTCELDKLTALLPADFAGTKQSMWATPTCVVLTVTVPPPSHGFVDVDCAPRNLSCAPSPSNHRYVDWNGLRLMPFADPDQVYVEKTRGT